MDEREFAAVLEEARGLLRAGAAERAVEEFAVAANLERQLDEPDDAHLQEALERRVVLFEAWGRALGLLEASKKLSSRNITLWATLIDFYLERRDHDLEAPERWVLLARDAYERAQETLLSRSGKGADGKSPDAPACLRLGVLATAVEDYEAAERYFERVVELRGDFRGAEANLGLIWLRRGDCQKAVLRFDAAVRADPDNIVLRGLLADTYARLGLLARAEDFYRSILRTAPCNIDALVGLGEVTTGLAEHDGELYLEAIRVFDRALEADRTMVGALPTRKGSKCLSRRQRASVLYSRGYARARLFEARSSRKSLALVDAVSLLPAARRDFDRALEADPGHFRAERAITSLGKPIRQIAQRAAEELASVVLSIVALGILVYVQVSFLSGSDRFPVNHYVALTFGLLVFLVAAFYLPAISKLKVRGAELQKTVTEQVSLPVSLGLARAGAADPSVRFFFLEDWDEQPMRDAPEKPAPVRAQEAFDLWRENQRERKAGVTDAETGGASATRA